MPNGGCRFGRAARKRKRKKQTVSQSVSLCHQLPFINLKKFLHKRGFSSTLLQPAIFNDTGRGLQALKTIKSGHVIISLPESCLLTTSTVLDSYLGNYIKSWTKPRLSPLLALCVFLVCERHRAEASDWFPYIQVLPETYTCPAYFSDDVISCLPIGVRRRGLEQRESVRELHSNNKDFFRSLQPVLNQPVEEVFTYEALRWAWCSVNTRSVFMTHPVSCFLIGPDVFALAPFLDLLNHRPDVQVRAGFNPDSRCYEIRSVCETPSNQQAFINYGSHDNQRLLLEYGFISTPNPHSVVYVDPGLLCDVLKGDKSLEQKMKFLRENHFIENLTVSKEGVGWRLLTALRLLSLPQTLYPMWKCVLLGQMVGGADREEWIVMTTKTICERLLQDTNKALDKIFSLSLSLSDDQSVRDQLSVVRALREEEQCLLGKCLTDLQQIHSDTQSHNQVDDVLPCQLEST